jgi:hypothetical protein
MNVYQKFSVLLYNIAQTTEMKEENVTYIVSASSGENSHCHDFYYTKWAASRGKIRMMKLSDKEMHDKTDTYLLAYSTERSSS